MDDQNINVFISSKMRDTNSRPCDFTAHFPPGLIHCGENQGINVNIISFDLLNSMYNINDFNNRITVISTDIDANTEESYEINILPGSYSVTELAIYLNSIQTDFSCFYTSIRNRFIIRKINENKNITLRIDTAGSFLGFNNGDEIHLTSIGIESSNVVNMVYFNKVIIRANGIDFEVSSLENISDPSSIVFNMSNILLWVSKQDNSPFQMITYNNTDGGNSYCYNIYNKFVNSINFQLTNEHGELIDDAPDWSMALQFTIYDKKDDLVAKELTIQTSYLREIFVFMNIFYSIIMGG